ncbi:MAG TPA: glycosyltransferase family 39 protein [Candidatus Limnocylindrales bacterium]|nr:glycosyltransferase family 39 protein [Candidatus Limnocylindrales bacterium]
MRTSIVDRSSRVEPAIVGSALLALGGAGAVIVLHGAALGWDESVYAVAARALLTGEVTTSVVALYRPPGLPALGTLAAITGFEDGALRGITLVLGVAAIAAAWFLGRATFGPRAAFTALVVGGSASVVLRELPLFHNDLASSGVLLLLMALLWHELEVRGQPGLALLLAGPLAAAAFYLRYGTLAGLVGIALVAAILWWRVLWRSRELVLATVGLALVLVLPHFLWAISVTGSPLGIVTLSANQVDTSNPLEALRIYARLLPSQLGGPVAAVFAVAGAALAAVVGVRQLVTGRAGSTGRGVAWLAMPALLAAAGTIAVSHAEARYVIFPLLLLVLLGAEALWLAFDAVVARLAPIRRAGAVPSALVNVALVLIAGSTIGSLVLRVLRQEPAGRWVSEPAMAVARASDGSCAIAASMYPIVAWYSGCMTMNLVRITPDDLFRSGAAEHWVMLSSEDASRASPDRREAFAALTAEPPVASREQGPNWSRAYRLSPPVAP